MYLVRFERSTGDTVSTRLEAIHNEHYKLPSGSIVKGINTIDSFSFSVLPGNPAFGNLNDFTTLVNVYNTRKRRWEFQGRVLSTSVQMDNKGRIVQEAICENYFGFLCDSSQEYVEERTWTAQELFEHIISVHNAQVETYKQFIVEKVEVTGNLYIGIQRENSWDTIKKKLIDTLGGELSFRVGSLQKYISWVQKRGETKNTEIALSRNLKSIVKEKDPSAFITRLIPLGAKVRDDSEERIDITSVNGGKSYIDDLEAIAEYGIHVAHVEFDDVTLPENLLTKARAWLKDNNKVGIKYSLTAIDLSALGLDMDDFDVCNSHPLKHRLLGISDLVRINKKTIDICDETKSTIEIGESFKSLSELQRDQKKSIKTLVNNIDYITKNAVTTEKLTAAVQQMREDTAKTYVASGTLEETLGNYAKKEDVPDVSDYAKKEDLPDLSNYAKKEDLPDLSGYAKKEDLPDLSGYAKKDDVPTREQIAQQISQALKNSGFMTRDEVEDLIEDAMNNGDDSGDSGDSGGNSGGNTGGDNTGSGGGGSGFDDWDDPFEGDTDVKTDDSFSEENNTDKTTHYIDCNYLNETGEANVDEASLKVTLGNVGVDTYPGGNTFPIWIDLDLSGDILLHSVHVVFDNAVDPSISASVGTPRLYSNDYQYDVYLDGVSDESSRKRLIIDGTDNGAKVIKMRIVTTSTSTEPSPI